MLVLMFAFSGAETALSLSGEVDRPERTVPRALLVALAGISLLYSSVHVVAFGALGQELAASTAAPLADAGGRLAGPWLANVMLAGTIVSMLGYLSASLMSQPRLLYSLGAGGLLPATLTAIHPRFRTPWIAIVVQNGDRAGGGTERLVRGAGAARQRRHSCRLHNGGAVGDRHAAACRAAWLARSRCQRRCRLARCCWRCGCCRRRGQTNWCSRPSSSSRRLSWWSSDDARSRAGTEVPAYVLSGALVSEESGFPDLLIF